MNTHYGQDTEALCNVTVNSRELYNALKFVLPAAGSGKNYFGRFRVEVIIEYGMLNVYATDRYVMTHARISADPFDGTARIVVDRTQLRNVMKLLARTDMPVKVAVYDNYLTFDMVDVSVNVERDYPAATRFDWEGLFDRLSAKSADIGNIVLGTKHINTLLKGLPKDHMISLSFTGEHKAVDVKVLNSAGNSTNMRALIMPAKL